MIIRKAVIKKRNLSRVRGKLIRDKIPEIIREKGGKPKIHIAGKKEYWTKLKEKLKEETDEFLESESMVEITDILEIIDAIRAYKKFNKTNNLSPQKEESKSPRRF